MQIEKESIILAKEMLDFLIVMKDKEMIDSVQKRDIVRKYILERYTNGQIDKALQILLQNGNIGILDDEDIFLINRRDIEREELFEEAALIRQISKCYGFVENEIYITKKAGESVEFSVCSVIYRLNLLGDGTLCKLKILAQR